MKKISFAFIIAVALLLVGCVSFVERDFTVDKSIEGEDDVEIDLEPRLVERDFTVDTYIDGKDVVAIGLVPVFMESVLNGDGTAGYILVVKNTSDSIVRVNWSKSSIYYNGRIYTPFITGQRYIDSNNPMPPSVVPVGETFNIEVYSNGQLDYQFPIGWTMMAMPSYDTVVTICVEHNDKDTYYVFTIDA